MMLRAAGFSQVATTCSSSFGRSGPRGGQLERGIRTSCPAPQHRELRLAMLRGLCVPRSSSEMNWGMANLLPSLPPC